MAILALTMGPQLGIEMLPGSLFVGSPGVISFRATGAIGQPLWALVSDTLPAEWDNALTVNDGIASLSTDEIEVGGTYSITIRCVDESRVPVVRTFTVRMQTLPLTISGAFPDWEVGDPVTGALTISGGVPPYSGLAITSGAMPSGVSLSIVGNQIVASGTPTTPGPWSATLGITDAASTPAQIVVSGSVDQPPGITAQYWRVFVTDTVGRNGYVAIGEVAMAASSGGSDLTSTANAIGSSQYSPEYAPSKAFDNNLETNWSSGNGSYPYSHWVGQKFGTPTQVYEIRITTAAASYGGPTYVDEDPKAFKLQYSADGVVWSTAKTITNQTGWSRSQTRTWAVV